MRAHQLDRLITIQRNEPSQSGSGAVVENWTTFAQAWAKKEDVSGSEFQAGEARQSEQVTKFTCRWIDGVTPQMRVVYDGADWEILETREIGRREGLEITARRFR